MRTELDLPQLMLQRFFYLFSFGIMVSHESSVSNNVKFLSVFKGFRMFS